MTSNFSTLTILICEESLKYNVPEMQIPTVIFHNYFVSIGFVLAGKVFVGLCQVRPTIHSKLYDNFAINHQPRSKFKHLNSDNLQSFESSTKNVYGPNSVYRTVCAHVIDFVDGADFATIAKTF